MSSTTDLELSPHVLIFDSGVGGLSVLREIKQQIPNCRYSYVTDNQGFPYGNKPAKFVIDRVNRTISACIKASSSPIDIVIIACNTASTVALPALRAQFQTPIIGVVPAIKPAATASSNQYIGLLATPATIKRSYTGTLIKEHGNGCHIVAVGSTELVLLAEKKLARDTFSNDDIKSILQPFLQVSQANPTPEKMDHLVLACTHFPLLRDEIQHILGEQVTLIDSGEAIAKRVIQICHELSLSLGKNKKTDLVAQFFITEDNTNIKKLAPTLDEFALNNIIKLTL